MSPRRASRSRATSSSTRTRPRKSPSARRPKRRCMCKAGHTPTTMEWARKLSKGAIKIIRGEAPYSEQIPDVDEGFTQADMKDAQRAAAIEKVIRARLAKCQKERPIGYLVRPSVPAED